MATHRTPPRASKPVFRPLFTGSLLELRPDVTRYDHGHWEDDYRDEVPSLLDPANDRHITLAEEDDRILGYVGWHMTDEGRSGQLQMVAVRADARRQGVGHALCSAVVDMLRSRGVRVVHIGTGGGGFHAPARALYESLGFIALPTVDYARVLQRSASAARVASPASVSGNTARPAPCLGAGLACVHARPQPGGRFRQVRRGCRDDR